jgi:hypothetical protein
MSWNKDTYCYKYKREVKFNHTEWSYSDCYDEDLYHDLMNDRWLFYNWCDFGNPKSIEELHQYRILTLLHKLKLKNPIKVIDQISWY